MFHIGAAPIRKCSKRDSCSVAHVSLQSRDRASVSPSEPVRILQVSVAEVGSEGVSAKNIKERALVLRKSVSAGEVSIHSLATLLVDDYRAYEATHFTLHHEALLELYHDQLDRKKRIMSKR